MKFLGQSLDVAVLKLFNAAGTFLNTFANATTAARTWTFPDKSGTLLVDSDLSLISGAELKNYSETVTTPTISAGVLTLNMANGNVFSVNHNANITSCVITNPPASGKAGSLTLILKQDATGGRTFAFHASWTSADNGTAPALSTTANKRNKLVLQTIDGGTTYDNSLAGKGY
jgi:hypothetical protein